MIPDILIIEEKTRRRARAWEPIPLHAPSPIPLRREERTERRKEESRSSVIIIDISDYSESTL
jgi:hypothetical protein